MLSEHPATVMYAKMLGGQPWTTEAQENWVAPPRRDFVIMPSGHAVSTNFVEYYLMNAPAWAPRMNAFEYVCRQVASGEEWFLSSFDKKEYDPRTNIVDPLADGGTGKPSPTLLPYYSDPGKWQ